MASILEMRVKARKSLSPQLETKLEAALPPDTANDDDGQTKLGQQF